MVVKQEAPSEAPSSQPSREATPDDPAEGSPSPQGDGEEAPPPSQPADVDEVHPAAAERKGINSDDFHLKMAKASPEMQSQVRIPDLTVLWVPFSLGSGFNVMGLFLDVMGLFVDSAFTAHSNPRPNQ